MRKGRKKGEGGREEDKERGEEEGGREEEGRKEAGRSKALSVLSSLTHCACDTCIRLFSHAHIHMKLARC